MTKPKPEATADQMLEFWMDHPWAEFVSREEIQKQMRRHRRIFKVRAADCEHLWEYGIMPPFPRDFITGCRKCGSTKKRIESLRRFDDFRDTLEGSAA